MKTAWRSPLAGAALIVVLTVLASLPAMHGGFLWDDGALITDNRMVKASDGLYRFWFTTEANDYRPMTWTLWWLEWRLWGDHPTGYHVVNILLHAVNAVLVWMILRRLKISGAWLAALVFAIHPVNVATVAWISEQKNTLSMLFYATAILLYLRFDEEGRWRWYAWSLAAFLLALLSKTAVVMLPVVLLGCVWRRHGRVLKKNFLCSVPYFVPALVMGLVTIFQHQKVLAGDVVRTGGFASRLAAAGWIPWFYLDKALLPLNLMVIYPKWEIDASRWLSYVPGMILIGCFTLFWRKREAWGRPLLFGLGYFVVTLFPVLGFFDQSFYSYSLVADHWQYYSIVGVIALAIAAGERVCHRFGKRSRLLGTVFGGTVLLVLGVLTWERSGMYADAEVLWRDNLVRNPNAAIVHNNLAAALVQAGRAPEAISHYQQALRIHPDYAYVHNNLGIALAKSGRVGEAVEQFELALQINPDLADVHNNLGHDLFLLGKLPQAIAQYEQALRIDPDYAEAHYNLGVALARVGRVTEAMEHWLQALRVQPDFAEAHYNLGVTLAQLGRATEAMEHWQQALRIQPDYAEAHYNLALALEQTGKPMEAIQHYQQALRVNPDFTAARTALARLHASQ